MNASNQKSTDSVWKAKGAGFTLVEILLATTIFLLLMAVALRIFSQTSQIWQRSTEEAKAFQSARLGFDLMTRNLSQATLNSYIDYVDINNNFPAAAGTTGTNKYDGNPQRYARQSDLHFYLGYSGLSVGFGTPVPKTTGTMPGTINTGEAVFFQFPGGYTTGTNISGALTYANMDRLMNACGYYVQFSDESSLRPPSGPGQTFPNLPLQKYRYRLMQMLQPTEMNRVYSSGTNPSAWFTGTNVTQMACPIADNVVALFVRPLDPADPTLCKDLYKYDSHPAVAWDASGKPIYKAGLTAAVPPIQPTTENQLPPMIQVTMVAIDELSAKHLAITSGTNQPTIIQNTLAGLATAPGVTNPGLFGTPTNLEKCVTYVEKIFQANHINYRIFSTTVPIRESKWTKQ